MKHTPKIIILLLAMFLITQLIGLWVISVYSPQINQIQNSDGELVVVKSNIILYTNQTINETAIRGEPPVIIPASKGEKELVVKFIDL